MISNPRSRAILVCRFSISAIVELLDPPALHADEMVVVRALVQFEDRLARFEMVAHQQPRLLELRQHAVDRGEPDVETFGQQLPVDVLGGQVADLGRLEQIDDLAAAAPSP